MCIPKVQASRPPQRKVAFSRRYQDTEPPVNSFRRRDLLCTFLPGIETTQKLTIHICIEPSDRFRKFIDPFYKQLQFAWIPASFSRYTDIPQYTYGSLFGLEYTLFHFHVPMTATPSPAASIVPTILCLPFSYRLSRRIPTWIRVLEWIAPRIEEAVVVYHPPRVRNNRIPAR